jgi:uncharacterized membrane protein
VPSLAAAGKDMRLMQNLLNRAAIIIKSIQIDVVWDILGGMLLFLAELLAILFVCLLLMGLLV